MDQHRLQLANRMHLQLLRELGQGIDVKRMLTDARYASDVLLACDAMPGHGLPELSAQFREAVQGCAREDGVARAAAWAKDSSGFGVSVPAGVAVDIDLGRIEQRGPVAERRRGWLKAAGWFAPR